MPQIPQRAPAEVARQGALLSPGIVQGNIERSTQNLLGPAEREFGVLEAADESRRTSMGQLRVTEILNDAQIEFANSNDYENFPSQHFESASEKLFEHIATLPADNIRDKIATFARASLERQQKDVDLRAVGLSQEATLVEGDKAIKANEAAFGLATTDESRLEIHDKTMHMIDEMDLSPAEKQAAALAFQKGSAFAFGAKEAVDDPHGLLADLDNKEHHILGALNGEDRETLRRGALRQIRQDRVTRDKDRADAAAKRIGEYDARTNSDNPPTEIEINADPVLTFFPAAKRGIIARLRGEFSRPDPELMLDLFERINDPEHPERITDKNDLLQYVNRGLPLAQLTRYQDMVTQNQDPLFQENFRYLAPLLKAGRARIDGTNSILGKVDAYGMRMANRWQIDVFERFTEGRKNGTSVLELIKEGGQHYIGDVPDSIIRTRSQMASDSFGKSAAEAGSRELAPLPPRTSSTVTIDDRTLIEQMAAQETLMLSSSRPTSTQAPDGTSVEVSSEAEARAVQTIGSGPPLWATEMMHPDVQAPELTALAVEISGVHVVVAAARVMSNGDIQTYSREEAIQEAQLQNDWIPADSRAHADKMALEINRASQEQPRTTEEEFKLRAAGNAARKTKAVVGAVAGAVGAVGSGLLQKATALRETTVGAGKFAGETAIAAPPAVIDFAVSVVDDIVDFTQTEAREYFRVLFSDEADE